MTHPNGALAVYASFSHFAMKLFFAAPASFFPFLSTALLAHASFLHFCKKLVLAAPARAWPFLSTALLSQVSCANAEPMVNADIKATSTARFIFLSIRRWTVRDTG